MRVFTAGYLGLATDDGASADQVTRDELVRPVRIRIPSWAKRSL